MKSTQAILELRGISKSFPGVVALDGVDFSVAAGEVRALMGENGAGKSTLIKLLTGVYERDEGRMFLAGAEINPHSPHEAQRLGISTVYQEVNLIPTLTVAENIFLGRQPTRRGALDWRAMREGARTALERLNMQMNVRQQLSDCSIAIQQMVAIARAVDISAKILILDEPTSSLSADEVDRLFAVVRLLRDRGMAVIFVTHFIDQVYAISDSVTVLRNGRLVGDFATSSLSRIDLIAAMMGRSVVDIERRPAAARRAAMGEPLAEARRLGKKGAIKPFALLLRKGEVLGLAGLLGAGRTEMAELLFGIRKPDEGRLVIDGATASITSPARAIAAGFSFCPEDRKTAGIIGELSVRENIALALQASKGWLPLLTRKTQEELAAGYIRVLGISTPTASKKIKDLSGGNQQKVMVARWLALHPRLLILDEPTRGIDVGTKMEIQKLILSLSREGISVLFISSELAEVVRCSQRVAVLRDRAKIGELDGRDIDEHAIMRYIAEGAR